MFRKLTLLCLLLALSVIVLGAYVRLSDAGLGCPDWPGCYGKIIVDQDPQAVNQANEAYPERPFEAEKAWKEMAHRYLAGALGFAILILALISWRVRPERNAAVVLSFMLLLLVVFQAALGMWTVTLLVHPVIVTSHLLAGLATLALITWLYLRTNPRVIPSNNNIAIKLIARVALLALVLQIALGGWTGANYAALACPDFPTCLGQWWPQVDYREGYNLARGFDIDYEGGVLDIAGRAAIHWVHRLGALVLTVFSVVLIIKACFGSYARHLRIAGIMLALLLVVQISLGIGNVLLRLPLALAVAHNAVAALLLIALVYVNFYATRTLGVVRRDIESRESLDERSPIPVDISETGVITPQPAPVPQEDVYVEKPPETIFQRLKGQLGRTRSGLADVLVSLPLTKKAIDESVLEEIETGLLTADVGIDTTSEIIDKLTERLGRKKLNDSEALNNALREILLDVLQPCSMPLEIDAAAKPFIILVVGVNGVGKTTTIGKMAKRFQSKGLSVMLAAGDTFRAAAIEQLQAWGERNKIPVIAQHSGADSASVIYDAVQSAQARGIDVLIADTAGRLHTKSNLMGELSKISRIMGKLDDSAPHEILLVLDAGTGQNAVSQASQFNEAARLTGIALTKLDGTAKGGVIFALARQLGIPIRYIGVGESIDDLQDFSAESFVDALLDHEPQAIEKPAINIG